MGMRCGGGWGGGGGGVQDGVNFERVVRVGFTENTLSVSDGIIESLPELF